MIKPNFFIIGAPKCGTTSLAAWLSEHPQVFMCPVKEPHYFSVDIRRKDRVNIDQYLSLFSDADNVHKIIGEASTRYLFSREAIPAILQFEPDAKFVAMVRNPVDMVYSLYNHLCFLGVEDVSDFRTAWSLSEERADGKRIPYGCNDPDSLNYKKIGLLGEQLNRFFDLVPPDQRVVLVLDDLRVHPERVLDELLVFLDIESREFDGFKHLNRSMAKRSNMVSGIIKLLAEIKKMSGISASFGILRKIAQFNRITRERDPLPPDFQVELKEYFMDDVKLISELLRRDFSFWESC